MKISDFLHRNAYAQRASQAHAAMGNATACQCPVTGGYTRHDTQSRTPEQFALEQSITAGNRDARDLVLGERKTTAEQHAGNPLTELHLNMEF